MVLGPCQGLSTAIPTEHPQSASPWLRAFSGMKNVTVVPEPGPADSAKIPPPCGEEDR